MLKNHHRVYSTTTRKRLCAMEPTSIRRYRTVRTSSTTLHESFSRKLPYAERSRHLGLRSLRERRLRTDLIETYKIENGIEAVTFEAESRGFVRKSAPRAGKRAQLRREVVKSCSQRHNFFYNRIVNNWNALPDKTTESKSVNSFKRRLKKA